MRKLFSVLLVFQLSFSLLAQENDVERGLQSITKNIVEAQLEFLASDWMEGRETGKEGQYMAADYIASMFNPSSPHF